MKRDAFLILLAIAVLNAGRVFFWDLPSVVGMGPDSIAAHFIEGGESYSNADNAFFTSTFMLGSPLGGLVLPFVVEKAGLFRAALIYTTGITICFIFCAFAIEGRNLAFMDITRTSGGFFGGSIFPLTLAVMTRWFGSGASSTFSFLILFYRSVYVVNAWLTPFVAEKEGLTAALFVGALACVASIAAARLAGLLDELARAKGEIGDETPSGGKLTSLSAFSLVPTAGYVMALVYGLGYTLVNVEFSLLKNFWQVRNSLSSTEAGEAAAVAHMCFIIGAIIMGQILDERYQPSTAMVICAGAEACALFLVANTTISPALGALLMGLPLGGFVVAVAPTLGNFCPEYSSLIYGFAAFVEAVGILATLWGAGNVLDAHRLPPCGINTARPGVATDAPAKIIVRSRTPLPCSDTGLASSEGFGVLLNVLAVFALVLVALALLAKKLDQADGFMNKRAAGAKVPNEELGEALVVEKAAAGSTGYGAI